MEVPCVSSSNSSIILSTSMPGSSSNFPGSPSLAKSGRNLVDGLTVVRWPLTANLGPATENLDGFEGWRHFVNWCVFLSAPFSTFLRKDVRIRLR